LAKQLIPDSMFFSAGIEPEQYVSPYSVRIMQKRGIDISQHTPRHIKEYQDESYTKIVCFSKRAYDYCLQKFSSVSIDFFDISDPWGSVGTDEQIMRIYDETYKSIEKIITHMNCKA
jgi:arsenate reductase (thioredoxin)